MFRQHKAPVMPWHHRSGIEICGGLRRFSWQHVDVLPVLVVLAVFHNGEIHLAKLLTDGSEMRAITGVATVVNLLLGRNEHKAAPQRLVALDAAPGKVTCRK